MRDNSVREALKNVGAVLAADPGKARKRSAVCTARWVDGLRCEVNGPNAHTIHTDMPRALGGGASTVSPGWYLCAAVASCTATVIAMRAASLEITLTALEVSVETETDQRGLLGLDERVAAGVTKLRTRVRIGADNADGDRLRTLVTWSDAHSPMACTVRGAPVCSIDVEVA